MAKGHERIIAVASAGLAALGLGTAWAADGGPSCLKSVGAHRAARYVQECLQQSPAVYPPCNAQNACDIILSEVRRGCQLTQKLLTEHPDLGVKKPGQPYALDLPAYCGPYLEKPR
jgi:hypothetical protein